MTSIEIDKLGRKLSISHANSLNYIRGNSFYFMCLLLASDNDEYLNIAKVRQLPKWRSMKVASVGKQIARIITNLRRQNINIIEWQNKTDGWRIMPKIAAQVSTEAKAAALNIIQEINSTKSENPFKADYVEVANWYISASKSIIAMTLGKSEEASDLINTAYKNTNDPYLSAVCDPMFTRIGQKLPKTHLSIPMEVTPNIGFLELAIEARVAAAQSARSDSLEWQCRFNDLENICSRLRAFGDFTSLARVTNGLAVLARRLQKHDQSLEYIKEAAGLAFFSGDLILMQSVAFNFANILRENQRSGDKTIATSTYIMLLRHVIEMRKEVGFGYDLTQADLLLAYVLFEINDYDGAKENLLGVRETVFQSGTIADRALYHNVNGMIALITALKAGTSPQMANHEIETALKLYDELNNELAKSALVRERDEALHNVSKKKS